MAIITILIASLLIIIVIILNLNKNKNYNSTNINFECGFNEKTTIKIPFSINFFILTILFLIFDLEISLIAPLIIINNLSKISIIFIIVFIILILDILINEWIIGIIEWTK